MPDYQLPSSDRMSVLVPGDRGDPFDGHIWRATRAAPLDEALYLQRVVAPMTANCCQGQTSSVVEVFYCHFASRMYYKSVGFDCILVSPYARFRSTRSAQGSFSGAYSKEDVSG